MLDSQHTLVCAVLLNAPNMVFNFESPGSDLGFDNCDRPQRNGIDKQRPRLCKKEEAII